MTMTKIESVIILVVGCYDFRVDFPAEDKVEEPEEEMIEIPLSRKAYLKVHLIIAMTI